MKPLIVLITVFAVSVLVNKIFFGNYEFALSARIGMSAMLAFTAIAHFAFTKGMAMMLPPFIPYKTEVVYLTGFIEVALAVSLLIPDFRAVASWSLIAFFVLILPANIYAAMEQVDYQKGSFDGNGLKYLWFRIPLQILFIVWTYLSSIKV